MAVDILTERFVHLTNFCCGGQFRNAKAATSHTHDRCVTLPEQEKKTI